MRHLVAVTGMFIFMCYVIMQFFSIVVIPLIQLVIVVGIAIATLAAIM